MLACFGENITHMNTLKIEFENCYGIKTELLF